MIYTEENTAQFFQWIEALEDVEDRKIHHPEKNVFNHTLQVLHIAFRESNDVDLILAAMLHDIGKLENTLGHDQIGADWLEGLVNDKTIWLVRNHLRIWDYLTGDMNKLKKCKELAAHPYIPELIQLARWDKKGRVPNKHMTYDKLKIISRLNEKASS